MAARGKRKIAIVPRREGSNVSLSTVGRILAHLVKRGAIVAVPVLRRRPQARCIRFRTKERYARRLPKGRKAKSPGELVQIDTLFVNIRPDKPVKHFTAYDPIESISKSLIRARSAAQPNGSPPPSAQALRCRSSLKTAKHRLCSRSSSDAISQA